MPPAATMQHRLSRAGNRRLNHMLYMAGTPAADLVTQLRQRTTVYHEENGHAFTAPGLLLTVWRPVTPDSPDGVEGRFFESVSLRSLAITIGRLSQTGRAKSDQSTGLDDCSSCHDSIFSSRDGVPGLAGHDSLQVASGVARGQ